ncbi:hypothetical protein EC991_007347, partial [Linnemannia zychae]
LTMSDHAHEKLIPQVLGSDNLSSIARIRKRVRKRDKLFGLLGIHKSKSKNVTPIGSNQSLYSRSPSQQSTRPSSIVSQVNSYPFDDNQSIISPSEMQEAKLQSSLQPSPPNMAQVVMDIFPDNIPLPVIKTKLPRLQERIESTKQLVYCTSLLLQDSLSLAATPGDELASDTALCLQKSTLDKAELDWLEEIKKDPMEQDLLRWLLSRMVEVFIAETTKDSVELAEIVSLGLVLRKESYRRLLSSLIQDFDGVHILDINLLQGLVELVQSTSSDYLDSDDLVKILSILRARLQSTRLVLDVMADHKVQDLDRVLQHEPLYEVLSGLKGSSDPYVMYQACYAFQALQFVPDDDSALQAVLRNSIGVVDGLVKVSAVFKLDLASVLEGLGRLQESLDRTVGVATTVYEGVSSLMESGQGVFDSLKEGLSSGQKRPWYSAIKAAYAFAQTGQLKDLRQLIFEAPCRFDPLFQWGICQLLDWARDESVRALMLTIVTKLRAASDHAVNRVAQDLLLDLRQDQYTSILHPYALTSRLPIPESSPILAKVLSIPTVEYDPHKLRLQRLKETQLQVYIPPMAKANPQACNDNLFSLMDKVDEFLASDRQVMLVLGDSGAGKSTFNKHLELVLLRSYTRGGRIPLFINLPAIERPEKELIAEQLRTYHFSEAQIQELRQHRQFIIICDGYDESQLTMNLHASNLFNRHDQWDVKMLISCRTQYLGQDYHGRFAPKGSSHYSIPTLDLFQEATSTPFSNDQIQDYVKQYVPLEPRAWTIQDYMDKLVTIPNLIDLVKNPFLLSLSLEALPKVTEDQLDLSAIKITRVQLFDTFVDHWLEVNKRRLEGNVLSKDDQDALDEILQTGFVSMGIDYSVRLASAIFENQDGNPVVQYIPGKDKRSWKAEFFGIDPEIRLLRESSLLTRTGSLFRFLHRSILEYFLSRAIFNPNSSGRDKELSQQPNHDDVVAQAFDPHSPLFTRSLLTEPSVIQFLCERVKQLPDAKKFLLAVIEKSKTDPAAATAAANAITILVRAGVRFNGADLRGVRIPGADLSNSQLDSVQLQDADLTSVTFAGSWLRQANFSEAQMNGVRFGELPFLKEEGPVTITAYSPDGSMLTVIGERTLSIYDTTGWNKAHQYSAPGGVACVAFSPNNQQFLFGKDDGAVQLKNFASNDTVFDMLGHTEGIKTVVFSPCGKQLASGSHDDTVRLWNSETGECMFVLKGHTGGVAGMAYYADGRGFVSGSASEISNRIMDSFIPYWPQKEKGDGMIRVWDSKTGDMVAHWTFTYNWGSILIFSADGQWVAYTLRGKIQIKNSVTGELGPVLNSYARR